jgi:hypothetical protein
MLLCMPKFMQGGTTAELGLIEIWWSMANYSISPNPNNKPEVLSQNDNYYLQR